MLTRDIIGVILILLIHEIIPHVLTSVLGCLREGRAQLSTLILKRLAHFVEGLGVLVSRKLTFVNPIILDDFLFIVVTSSESLLELVSTWHGLVIPCVVTS